MPYATKNNPSLQEEDKKLTQIRSKVHDLIREFHHIKFDQAATCAGVDMIETSGKVVGPEELINGIEAVLDGWWTDGRFADTFSKLLRNYLDVKLCLLTNSGSSANLVAFFALTSPLLGSRQVRPGDEVITVAAAFPTTVSPIVQAGCVPVFVDIDLATLNIDWKQLEKALSPKTKAIMIAHTQGNPFNLEKVVAFARAHNLWLVEDSCDALGAEYKGKKVGTFGDIATFSFYPAHQMTMGEGGAIVTNNAFLFRIAKSFRDWGRDCWCETGEDDACRRRFTWKFKNLPLGYDHKFVYSHLGYNLKLTDMQAAIGVAQIGRIDEFIKARREHYMYLYELLSPYSAYFQFQEAQKDSNPSWFGFMLTLKKKCPFTLTQLCIFLNSKKIATRPLYCGNITRQPFFEHIPYRAIGALPNSDYIMERTFWIGVHPKLTQEHMKYMALTIGNFIDQKLY
ncbi:MAG: lipopolysaccharide biosynthesis protein RfbH [Patescibacteria group bacterium]